MHPTVVVYGFFDHHVERNVAPPEWLAVMAATAKHEEWLASPFAYLDAGGELAIGGPIQYPLWPLREHSALVNFLQHEYARLDGRHRRAQADRVTIEILRRFRDDVESKGARFVVMDLRWGARYDALRAAIERAGIEFSECTHPTYPSRDTIVDALDGHPNVKVHKFWAKCLAWHLGMWGNEGLPASRAVPSAPLYARVLSTPRPSRQRAH